MNSYYKIIHFLKDFLLADEDVNTVTHGAINDIDIQKKNIYPLAHLEVLRAGFPADTGMVRVDFNIHILDQRNVSKVAPTDKFLGNDNEIDNLNTCLAVINRLVFTLRTQYNDIELLNEPEPTPVQFDFTNTLDGWNVELQLATTNNVTVCE